MYEFRGATLQAAVHQALRYPALSTKKLAKIASKFDFTSRMRAGSVLFVGEGNLSFALTISRKPRVPTPSILATVYEAEEELTDTAYENAKKLLNLGCSVKTGVDATRLSDTIGKRQFRTIIFQFPNVASRDPRYGQNPNHVLVTRFLKNARNHLKPGGLVVISTVDSPFYEGAFKMDEAARKAGFAALEIYTFDPKDYPGYIHQNTANEESARSLPPMATPPSQLSFFPDEWPEGLTYLENYISEDEADRLVQKIDAAPWRADLKRRVQHYGYRYDYKARQARREDYLGPLPELFQQLAERLTIESYFQLVPDQVIVNEYQPGQGISAHIDCKPCFGETIASLSLLSACVMRFAGRILPFDSDAAQSYATIAAARRSAGRPIAQADCQIASIAHACGATVATRNTPDFEGCEIDLINPWTSA